MSEADWNIECSDEEYKTGNNQWEPTADVIEKMYSILDRGELPDLNWKSPGYRSPSPELREQPQQEANSNSQEDKSDFDFMDEMGSPKLKIRNKEDRLKGSAKKKTTSLDGVINNMRRHSLLQNTDTTQTNR